MCMCMCMCMCAVYTMVHPARLRRGDAESAQPQQSVGRGREAGGAAVEAGEQRELAWVGVITR